MLMKKIFVGVKGISYMMVDVHNRIKGSFEKGKLDTTAIIGKNLNSTLSKDIQSYGERLLRGKVGSIIAIEPSHRGDSDDGQFSFL